MAKIPLITIIGVPNTGKSTLFNRLIGKRKALVHSQAGMTRDIYKKPFEIDGKEFSLQDSGGFFPDDHIITNEINKRIYREAEASDLIIFLFDGRRELMGYEQELFLEIRKINDNIIPVINKVDKPSKFILPSSYYPLKQDYILISAEHNLAVEELIEAIEDRFESYVPGFDENEKQSTVARISIMGKPNVGKSSLINKILNDEFVIVSPLPGTTRDSVDLEVKRKNKTFILVDNAGIRKLKKVKEDTESAAVIRAEKDIRQADIIIFVIDVSKRIDQTDLLIAHKILKSAKPVIVACNKWDLVNEDDKKKGQEVLAKLLRTFNFFYFAPFIFVSAITGKNVFSLIDKAEEINDKLNTKIKTPHLNKIVPEILSEKKFLTESSKEFKAKYISIESYRPFFVHFRASSDERIKASHETYIKKRIVEAFDLEGIPVFFKVSAKGSRKK